LVLNVSFIALGMDRAEASLGQYTAAQRLAFGLFSSFGTLLGLAFFPVLSRQFKDDTAAAARTLRLFWLLACAGSLSVAAIGVGLPEPLMQWIYSAAYRPASSVFAALMVAAALMLLESPLVYSMLATGHERLVLGRGALTACLSVVLNIALVPGRGAMGAAIANLVAILAGLITSAIAYAAVVRSQLRVGRPAEAPGLVTAAIIGPDQREPDV
jgi:O-antigen/teichoic acid export membrane protein